MGFLSTPRRARIECCPGSQRQDNGAMKVVVRVWQWRSKSDSSQPITQALAA
jgi:hypothetical protein